MKTFLIAVSLAVNLFLAAFAVRPSLAPPAFRDFFGGARDGPARVASGASATANAGGRLAPLWSRLQTDDLPALVARLRAAGFPTSLIRAVITAKINARYNSQFRALLEPDPSAPYWKQSNQLSMDSKNYAEYTRLQRERSKLLRELFNDPVFASEDVSAAQRRLFGDIPRQKIDLIQRVEDDYADMTNAARAATGGIILPGDKEKLALLANEKHADLAAILSPDELADYELRSSPLVNLLGRYLGGFDASETEFRAVFQAQQKYSATVAPAGGLPGNIDPETRQAALQQLNDDLKNSLGDARYADYQRETNRDFQQLSRIAQQENVSSAVAAQAYNLRDAVATESNRILDDTTLSAPEKRAALQALAQNTRAQTLTLLGPTAGAAYVKIEDGWLTAVEHGSAVTFNNNSSTSSIATVGANGATAMLSFTGGASFRRMQ
ncbi:MAG TPA: hypothetical protein VG838_04535 [Opitutaceae bacterium]|nr:hypothetical protein [Opitutaceae bacterium]